MKKLWGIRADEEVETAGLDVSEHGMWGYPEFYIPVPGGYGTETHGHLLGAGHVGHARRYRRAHAAVNVPAADDDLAEEAGGAASGPSRPSAGDRGQEDHGRAFADLGVEAVEGAGRRCRR